MKKIFLSALFFIAFNNLFAQKSTASPRNLTDQELSQYYLKKSRDQKAGAFVLMASGLTLGIIGGIGTIHILDSERDYSSAYTMIGIGAASFLASIPLFMGAAKNKNRATLAIGNQRTPIGKSIGLTQSNLSLIIPLGR